MNSPSAAPASAKTIKSLEEEVRCLAAKLAAAEDAKAYYKTKATECSSAITELRRDYEDIIANEGTRRGEEIAVAVADNARLQKLRRDDAATIGQMGRDIDRYMGFNKQDLRMQKSLKAQNDALSRANHRLSGKDNEFILKKRSADSLTKEDDPAHKKPRLPHISACTQCHVHGWACDDGSPCENCLLRNKHHGCKRVMCKYFKKRTCPTRDCKYVHEDDEQYQDHTLVPFTRLTVKRVGASPKEIKAAEEQKNISVAHKQGGTKKMKTPYDIMFDRHVAQVKGGRKGNSQGKAGSAPK